MDSLENLLHILEEMESHAVLAVGPYGTGKRVNTQQGKSKESRLIF